MIKSLKISTEHWKIMQQHVEARAPLEACGLLVGQRDRVEKVFLIRNQAQSPVRFRMDPLEQLEALEWIEANGLDLLGIFHSHPTGPETVSTTDIEEAAYEVVHIIWSRTGVKWMARGFWIEDKQATEVTIQLQDTQ